jgi:hypothetical protein
VSHDSIAKRDVKPPLQAKNVIFLLLSWTISSLPRDEDRDELGLHFLLFGRVTSEKAAIRSCAIHVATFLKVLPTFREGVVRVWASKNFVGIVIVLAIVFPVAERADFKGGSATECGEAAAGAQVSG